jgi:hypothetical protein
VWSFRFSKGVLRSFFGWKEFDFAMMSVDSFEVGALPGVVLSTDDLTTLVGLHTNKCLVVLRNKNLVPTGSLTTGPFSDLSSSRRGCGGATRTG